MRRLTADEIDEAIRCHREYVSSLQPGVGTLDKQRVFIAEKESAALRCPLCSGYVPPFIARAAYYAADTGFNPLPQPEGDHPTNYACSLCGTRLRYVVTIFAGSEHWGLVAPTVVEDVLRALVNTVDNGQGVPNATATLGWIKLKTSSRSARQLLETLAAIRKTVGSLEAEDSAKPA